MTNGTIVRCRKIAPTLDPNKKTPIIHPAKKGEAGSKIGINLARRKTISPTGNIYPVKNVAINTAKIIIRNNRQLDV